MKFHVSIYCNVLYCVDTGLKNKKETILLLLYDFQRK